MTKATDIAYCAGLIDGEGYIGIKRASATERSDRQTRGYHARIVVHMVDEQAIKFLAETLGGWYYPEKQVTPQRRPLFKYQATDAAAERILRTVLPYLKVKRMSAETVLRLRDLQANAKQHRTKITGYRDFPNSHGTIRQVPNLSYSDEYVAICDTLYEQCKHLNRVGPR